MKLLDKYFQPYAEYCIRTTFSEDKLKEVLVKECPKSTDILSIRKLKAIVAPPLPRMLVLYTEMNMIGKIP